MIIIDDGIITKKLSVSTSEASGLVSHVVSPTEFTTHLHPELSLILVSQEHIQSVLKEVKVRSYLIPIVLVVEQIEEAKALEFFKLGVHDILYLDRAFRLHAIVQTAKRFKAMRDRAVADERAKSEIILRETEESRQRLEELIRQMPAPVAMFDKNMIYLAHSESWLTEFQLPLASLVGQSHYHIFPEIPERWKKIHQRCLYGVVERSEADPFERADGTQIWLKWEVRPWRDPHGNVMGLMILTEDITPRVKSHELTRASQQRLSGIIDSSMDGIVSIDETLKVVLFNKAAEKMFGYREEEMLGQSLDRLMPARFRAAHSGMIREFDLKGQTNRAMGRFGTVLGVRAGGEEFPIEASISKLEQNGSIIYTATLRDVSERVKAEQALRESERFARATVDALPANLVILDTDGKILAVNKLWRDFAAQNPPVTGNVLEGANYFEACEKVLGEDALAAATFASGIRDVIRGIRETYEQEYACHSPKEKRWFIASVTRFPGDGPVRVVISHFNITDRKLSEEAQNKLETQLRQAQKMESLGTLAGGIAHDFNNILGIIYGNAELVQLALPKEHKNRKHIDNVLKAGARAKDLVQQILTFSRQREQQRRVIKLDVAVEESVQLLRSTLPASVELNYNTQQKCPSILADSSQIHQIVMNLVTNAWQAMPQQRGKIEIEITHHDFKADSPVHHLGLPVGRYLRLLIRDNGSGMEASVIERIFDPFFTTKAPGEGTGLGLAVVHGIMRNHDGAVDVESQVGAGTTFYLYFPVFGQGEYQTPDPVARLPMGNGEHILLVDDEPVLLDTCKDMLENLGYRVSGVSQPQKAVEWFKEKPELFQLIISDYMMPVLNGIQLAQEVRKTNASIPVVLSTGYSSGLSLDLVKDIDVRQIIMKPWSMEIIARAVSDELKIGEKS